jgi:hypothetical protein
LKGFSGVEIWKTLPHPVYLKLNEICPNFWGMLRQTLTYTDLLNLVDNSEYPFDSYEFLENKGFIFTESQDYAVALDLETMQGKLRVEGCKMTY